MHVFILVVTVTVTDNRMIDKTNMPTTPPILLLYFLKIYSPSTSTDSSADSTCGLQTFLRQQ